MKRMIPTRATWKQVATLLATALLATNADAQTMGEFPRGSMPELEQLPAGRFRDELQQLPPQARQNAQAWLHRMHFTKEDTHSMHTDANGGICFACNFQLPPPEEIEAAMAEADAPDPALSAVPISPFPDSLKFSSRPGATNVIYINFSGQVIEGTEWNKVVDRASIPTLPFSTDSDYTTFSASEQVAIKRIWQRMAEDFAPFNVNVTTVPPATITNRTAVALITRNTDANGLANPFNNAGGVAYVNVFGRNDYASRYSPAFVYHNNLSNNESFIAEAASHEIGHNLGLTHDGLTTGAEYYGGHGSGETSWATIMGLGYNRNVSQWSKGEYYNANNTQDDLAIIAGKLGYRPDDHGNTPGSATPLAITNGNQIVSTNFENDPANTNPANKGVIERTTDVDVFSFINGNGQVSITASPWVMPAGTRGGNLDILLEIRDESGQLIAASNPPDRTAATIETTLSEGQYFLHVRNTGTGNPFSTSPTGYTSYGSLGTYYLSGNITDTDGFNPPPIAQLAIGDITAIGVESHQFTVTYSDDFAIDVSTIGTGNIRVAGPGGFDQIAQFVSVDSTTDGSPRTATYAVSPPGGSTWTPASNGSYDVLMEENQVADTQGEPVPAGQLGEFQVAIASAIYVANMDSNPGWTLQSGTQNRTGWQFGPPAYTNNSNAPSSAFTGTNIIGYVLSGNYQQQQFTSYATTPPIDASSSSNLTLQFRRWLRIAQNAGATIEVSTNGTQWSEIWAAPARLTDNSWQLVQYSLPSFVAGSTSLQIRWKLSKSGGNPQTDIGWNIDDVLILGDGAVDTAPPQASLNVGGITQIGAPSHSCSVTYTDDTAVRLSSLDELNLRITGPNGYDTYSMDTDTGVEMSTLGFAGADLPADGSPITASYDIPPPDGQEWRAADNGTYTITLREGTVEDTLNNVVSEAILGTFDVAISEAAPGELTITPETAWLGEGETGGPFTPASITYTLGNTGESALDWTASKTATWFDLNSDGGSIQPGATVEITASLSAQAEALEPGDYTDLISFVNASSGVGNTIRDVVLSIAPGGEVTRFTSYGLDEEGRFLMLIVGNPGDPVTVQWSDDMVTWNTLVSTGIGPEGTLVAEDPTSVAESKRFYRVRTEP